MGVRTKAVAIEAEEIGRGTLNEMHKQEGKAEMVLGGDGGVDNDMLR